MPLCTAAPVHVSNKDRRALEALARQRSAPQGLVRRAQIVLLAADGVGVRASAEHLGIGRATVQRWRRRWSSASAAESALERLVDAPRTGTPATFTPEQIGAILSLACEPPKRDGRELTHWTHADLAAEAVARGIVASISPDSIGRFLREADLKPHRVRGWINTPRNAQSDEKCQDVCETYRLAPERAAAGIETHSIDEMTGVQALERAAATWPARTEEDFAQWLADLLAQSHLTRRCALSGVGGMPRCKFPSPLLCATPFVRGPASDPLRLAVNGPLKRSRRMGPCS
jgi:transposase